MELGGLLWTRVLKLALPPQRHGPDAWLEQKEPFIHTAQNKREKKYKERKEDKIKYDKIKVIKIKKFKKLLRRKEKKFFKLKKKKNGWTEP